MNITVNNMFRSYVSASIFDMGDIIAKDYRGKEVILVNTLKSCLRDDKLTLQGIEEERNKTGVMLDITKRLNLGLIYIFIDQHGIEMDRLQWSKRKDPNVFEDILVIYRRNVTANANDSMIVATRIAAIVEAIRLFAESDIQFRIIEDSVEKNDDSVDTLGSIARTVEHILFSSPTMSYGRC